MKAFDTSCLDLFLMVKRHHPRVINPGFNYGVVGHFLNIHLLRVKICLQSTSHLHTLQNEPFVDVFLRQTFDTTVEQFIQLEK